MPTGARVGLCELPRDLISSDERGGVGGTCVLRGCVPKKLMALAGLFREEWQDAASFGCAAEHVCLLDAVAFHNHNSSCLLADKGQSMTSTG